MPDWKVKIYRHPNQEIRSFLTDLEISALRVEKFRRPLEKDRENALKSLGTIGAQVVKEILAIQEVRDIQIKPKEVRITKEASCSWEEIEERILEILRRALKRKQIRLVKG
jgi:hypothetical protein